MSGARIELADSSGIFSPFFSRSFVAAVATRKKKINKNVPVYGIHDVRSLGRAKRKKKPNKKWASLFFTSLLFFYYYYFYYFFYFFFGFVYFFLR